MAPDANVLINYKPAASGDMVVEVVHETLVPVQGYGALKLELPQPGGITAIKLQNIAHAPALGCNLLFSTRPESERSGESFNSYPDKA